jgi:hypothetical protein
VLIGVTASLTTGALHKPARTDLFPDHHIANVLSSQENIAWASFLEDLISPVGVLNNEEVADREDSSWLVRLLLFISGLCLYQFHQSHQSLKFNLA